MPPELPPLLGLEEGVLASELPPELVVPLVLLAELSVSPLVSVLELDEPSDITVSPSCSGAEPYEPLP